jgi:hypothetical protein
LIHEVRQNDRQHRRKTIVTARTSQKLADALRKAGLEELAKRAELDEFHDYLSPHDLPEIMLDMELLAVIHNNPSIRVREAAGRIREMHHGGDFDADTAESDEWAKSPDGQATFNLLVKDVKGR